MEDESKKNDERPKRRVRRYSPDRLLRQPVVLSGGGTVSVEKHRGRLAVRVEVPDGERQVQPRLPRTQFQPS
jgi:hypothetical protein